MKLDVKKHLTAIVAIMDLETKEKIQVPDIVLEPENITMIMISEVPPQNTDDYFYSRKPNADYIKSTVSLFKQAGVEVETIDDIIDMGIYITTAVKTPKSEYTVQTNTIKEQLPILESELDLFPNLKVIMLMGDVAKKAVNAIAKARSKKNIIPSESTYKIRSQEFFYGDIRVFPSYIMTGGNILIEKSKVTMIVDDIKRAMVVLDKR